MHNCREYDETIVDASSRRGRRGYPDSRNGIVLLVLLPNSSFQLTDCHGTDQLQRIITS